MVYGKKLIHSLTPPFIFNQHNAQTGQKTPRDSRQPRNNLNLKVVGGTVPDRLFSQSELGNTLQQQEQSMLQEINWTDLGWKRD